MTQRARSDPTEANEGNEDGQTVDGLNHREHRALEPAAPRPASGSASIWRRAGLRPAPAGMSRQGTARACGKNSGAGVERGRPVGDWTSGPRSTPSPRSRDGRLASVFRRPASARRAAAPLRENVRSAQQIRSMEPLCRTAEDAEESRCRLGSPLPLVRAARLRVGRCFSASRQALR